MKKRLLVFLLIIASLSIMLLSSCGSQNNSSSESSIASSDATSSIASSDVTSSVASSDATSSDATSSVASSDAASSVATSSSDNTASSGINGIITILKPEFDQMNESLKSMMKMSVTGKGDSTLVIAYQYTIVVGDNATIKTSIDSQKDTLKTAMDPMLTLMKQNNISAPKIIIEYRNKDGSLIVSYTFK